MAELHFEVPQPPSTSTLLRRGITVRCPACGGRGLFPRHMSMLERCPSCGLVFERIAGHWMGAIFISLIICIPALALTLIVGMVATAPDIATWPVIGCGLLVGIALPLLVFPLTRTLWTAIDIVFRPLRADEVNWLVAGEHPSKKDPAT